MKIFKPLLIIIYFLLWLVSVPIWFMIGGYYGVKEFNKRYYENRIEEFREESKLGFTLQSSKNWCKKRFYE